MYLGFHKEFPLFLSHFKETWIFYIYFFEKYLYIHLYETRPVGLELFHVSGQTDMTKLLFAVRNFAKAAKMIGKLRCSGRYGMHFVTEVPTFWMKVLPLSSTRNMETTASSKYLARLYDITQLYIQAAVHPYHIQSSKFIQSHVLEIILLLK
jgi:hypothetical protein